MKPVIIIDADDHEIVKIPIQKMNEKGYHCRIALENTDILDTVIETKPSLLLLVSDNHANLNDISRIVKEEHDIPVFAMTNMPTVKNVNGHIDDFAVEPFDNDEIVERIGRLLKRTNKSKFAEVIRAGELTIDLARYEVFHQGKLLELTFREYELLKYLASNPERVFTRDTLLNKVWGYDYYGGDRTVDVHIRRLRSKIEDTAQQYIETVRNIGYRFRGNRDNSPVYM